jgi:hypothetical protein
VGETTPARDQESESIEIGTHARLFEQRLSPDAYFRLQLVFPAGYPLGPIRSVVRLKHEPDKFDSAEGLRLEALARSTKDGDGFRRAGAAVTLSVPAPKINRHYEIVWDLPTKRARRAWLAAERRRMADD